MEGRAPTPPKKWKVVKKQKEKKTVKPRRLVQKKTFGINERFLSE